MFLLSISIITWTYIICREQLPSNNEEAWYAYIVVCISMCKSHHIFCYSNQHVSDGEEADVEQVLSDIEDEPPVTYVFSINTYSSFVNFIIDLLPKNA